MKLRVYSNIRRGKERWWLAAAKEVLAGPYQSMNDAREAKKEWMFKI